MAKTYGFQFPGTEEDLLGLLNKYPSNNGNFFFLDDYIVKIENGEYKFGVARGGHSGGYWYLPEMSEKDGFLCFTGKIQYVSPFSPEKGFRRVLDTIGTIIETIILFPLILIIDCCMLIVRLIKKWKGAPKEVTTEDQLYDLMVNYLHCAKVARTGR